jgi:hypothetical protein
VQLEHPPLQPLVQVPVQPPKQSDAPQPPKQVLEQLDPHPVHAPVHVVEQPVEHDDAQLLHELVGLSFEQPTMTESPSTASPGIILLRNLRRSTLSFSSNAI